MLQCCADVAVFEGMGWDEVVPNEPAIGSKTGDDSCNVQTVKKT
jgi:hypothetical protein